MARRPRNPQHRDRPPDDAEEPRAHIAAASSPWKGAAWLLGHADGGGNDSEDPSGPRGE